MKIYTHGARFFAGQIARIDQCFKEFGHELVQNIDEADLIYSNNFWNDEIIRAKQSGEIHGKIVFNCLDLAPHLGDEFPLDRFSEQAIHADAVTTISQFVQSDLVERAGIENAPIIYQPIKPVSKTGIRSYPYRAMFVGRVNDGNKRAAIGANALQILGFEPGDVVTVGSDQPFYGGVWAGQVDDIMLNSLYNSVDFVMFPSFAEGLGLPALESAAAGAIPVICRDLTTREEFFPSTIFPEYLEVEPTAESIARFMGRFLCDNGAMKEFKERVHKHFAANWADKLSGRGVAAKILGVYEEIK